MKLKPPWIFSIIKHLSMLFETTKSNPLELSHYDKTLVPLFLFLQHVLGHCWNPIVNYALFYT